jgi:hypothetical protein
VADSAFEVYLLGDCGDGSWVESTPAQAGLFKVAEGDSKEQNFKVDTLYCGNIP